MAVFSGSFFSWRTGTSCWCLRCWTIGSWSIDISNVFRRRQGMDIQLYILAVRASWIDVLATRAEGSFRNDTKKIGRYILSADNFSWNKSEACRRSVRITIRLSSRPLSEDQDTKSVRGASLGSRIQQPHRSVLQRLVEVLESCYATNTKVDQYCNISQVLTSKSRQHKQTASETSTLWMFSIPVSCSF